MSGDESDNGGEADAPSLSQQEFYQWKTPANVYKQLYQPHRGEGLVAAIINRLGNKQIRAAAELMVIEESKDRSYPRDEERVSFALIPPKIWKIADLGSPAHRFWTFGDFLVFHSDNRNSMAINARPMASFTGVRFEPSGVTDLADAMGLVPRPDAAVEKPDEQEPEAAAKKASGSRRGMPRLPEARLKEWFDLFRKAYPEGSKQLAERSAQGMFPEHEIGRERVRDFFPDAKMGRPLKNPDK